MADCTDMKRSGTSEDGAAAISLEQHLCAKRQASRMLATPPMKIGRRYERPDGKVPRKTK